MVFQNRIDQLDFPDKQHTALDMLKDFMILKRITVIEHDVFFGEAIFNDEPDLAMFWYKIDDKNILSHENLDHDIKLPVSKRVFWTFNFIDIFWHNIYYFIVYLLQSYAFILSPRVFLLK